MLKGIDPLLGPDLLMILRGMGHGDEIAVEGAFALVASGERALYGNIVLRKGVVRQEAKQ